MLQRACCHLQLRGTAPPRIIARHFQSPTRFGTGQTPSKSPIEGFLLRFPDVDYAAASDDQSDEVRFLEDASLAGGERATDQQRVKSLQVVEKRVLDELLLGIADDRQRAADSSDGANARALSDRIANQMLASAQ